VSGDLVMTAEVEFLGTGKNPHRKAGWMVRQSLAPDAAYADFMVHGSGLIALQYRKVQGGPTLGINTTLTPPATLRLERDGDLFTLSIAKQPGNFEPVGSITVPLGDPVYAGLAACSHEENTSETALIKNVDLEVKPAPAGAKRVRETSLEIISIETGQRRVVYRANEDFEAPNWSLDGKRFYINGGGRIWTVPLSGGQREALDTGSAQGCNNDHGLSPDGQWLAISHSVNKASRISIIPAGGGSPRQVTPLGPSYWHGWSPDGATLAYCAQRNGEFDVYTIPVAGGEEKRLTTAPGLDDGPEYTPDGQYIYFNSERSGLMKIWRMRPDGSQQEPVTTDKDYADWFPHPSPDGKWLVFLSFDKSITGHPPNKDVVLRLMPASGGKPQVLASLFGGQGTMNVPSWSPDSKSVAFVSYRHVLP